MILTMNLPANGTVKVERHSIRRKTT